MSDLILGWQLTPTGDPRYWVSGKPKPGHQASEDLVTVPAEALDAHTAVIAQSGAGKSFFLGRLIEEIVARTKSRCLILDPNGDFRRLHELQDASNWSHAQYDSLKRVGWLPHESSRAEFESLWSTSQIRIQMGATGFDFEGAPPFERIQLWWPSLSSEFLAEDLDPMVRNEVYHCHGFVQTIGRVVEMFAEANASRGVLDVIEVSEAIYQLAQRTHAPGVGRDLLRSALHQEWEKRFSLERLERQSRRRSATATPYQSFSGLSPSRAPELIRRRLESMFDRAVTALEYVSPEVGRFYFGRAREYRAAGIVARRPPSTFRGGERVRVLDLPSLPQRSTRLLAISTTLATEWQQARSVWEWALSQPPNADTRVPTFIVVDEAHNLMSREPGTNAEVALREQFRTIVAEGRKYGLFLLVVTQRPDKIDPMILSECENKALMRIGSAGMLQTSRDMLGLEGVPHRVLDKCLEFGPGRALLSGRWAPEGGKLLYTAARRTAEGGRNLRPGHWGTSVAMPQSSLPLAARAKRKTSRLRSRRRRR